MTRLDRWDIRITNDDIQPDSGGQNNHQQDEHEKQQNIPFNIINNYFSIGVVSMSSYSKPHSV